MDGRNKSREQTRSRRHTRLPGRRVKVDYIGMKVLVSEEQVLLYCDSMYDVRADMLGLGRNVIRFVVYGAEGYG